MHKAETAKDRERRLEQLRVWREKYRRCDKCKKTASDYSKKKKAASGE